MVKIIFIDTEMMMIGINKYVLKKKNNNTEEQQ